MNRSAVLLAWGVSCLSAAAALAQPLASIPEWRWERVEQAAREGHTGVALEAAAGDGGALTALQPANARQALLLGVSGVRAVRVEALAKLEAGEPLPENLETALTAAGKHLANARALLGSGDRSLPAERIQLALESIDAYRIVIDHLLAEHEWRKTQVESVTLETVRQRTRKWIEESARSGDLADFLGTANQRATELNGPRQKVKEEADKVAAASAGLDSLRTTLDSASRSLAEVQGEPGQEPAGLRPELDKDLRGLENNLKNENLALCEPPVETAPGPTDGLYQVFRYLCPKTGQVRAAQAAADALNAHAGERSSTAARKQAALDLLDLLLSDEFRNDETEAGLRELRQRLENHP